MGYMKRYYEECRERGLNPDTWPAQVVNAIRDEREAAEAAATAEAEAAVPVYLGWAGAYLEGGPLEFEDSKEYDDVLISDPYDVEEDW